MVLLKRSSRGPLRLVVFSESGDVEQMICLNDYTFISRCDPSIRQHSLAISFRSRPSFRFSTESGRYKSLQSANAWLIVAFMCTEFYILYLIVYALRLPTYYSINSRSSFKNVVAHYNKICLQNSKLSRMTDVQLATANCLLGKSRPKKFYTFQKDVR